MREIKETKLHEDLRFEANLPKWAQHRFFELRQRIKELQGEHVTHNYGVTTPSLTDLSKDPCRKLYKDLPLWAQLRLFYLRQWLSVLENTHGFIHA